MPLYAYRGLDAGGRAVGGVVDAESPRGARIKLRKTGVFPTDLNEEQRAAGPTVAVLARRADLAQDRLLLDIADPLSRLVAAGVLFQAGLARPAMLEVAVRTASDQAWSRPLLAWLQVQASLAEQTGEPQLAQRLRRRIELVLSSPRK